MRKNLKAQIEHKKSYQFSSQLVSVLDENAIICYVPESHAEKLGYASEELEGRCAFEFVHPDDIEKVQRKFSEMVESKQQTNVYYRFLNKGKSWSVLESRGCPIIQDGSFEGFFISSLEQQPIDLVSIVKRVDFDAIRASAKKLNMKKGVGQ